MATEKRTSEQGTVFDVALVRNFLLTALEHDAVTDRVHDLIFEHVMERKYHPSVVATSLEPIIAEVLGIATFEDWDWIARTFIAQACEALEVEYHLNRTPEAQPPQTPTTTRRALRSLDPGELREKLAKIYAQDSISPSETVRAWWITRRISQLTGISREQITADAKTDAEAIKAGRGDDKASTDQSSANPNTSDEAIVRPLTSEEVDSLKFIHIGHQADDLAARNQAEILLGSDAGCTTSQIAAMLVANEAKVREVIADFNERGIAGIAETRRAERERVIATARNLDPESFDTDTREARPGKYEGASDLLLVVALDVINGHGFADESTGDVAMSGYAWRVNRFVGIEDSQGFIRAEDWPTARQAAGRLRDFDVPTEDEES